MCVNLSQPVSCSSSFFPPPSLHPLPSLWFELDNENNEFGVCFFLWLSRPPPTSFSSRGDPVSDSQPPTSLSLFFHFCLHIFKVWFSFKFFFLSSRYQHVACSSSASLLSLHPFSSVLRSPSRSLSFCVISCSSCSIISLSEVVLTSTIQLHIHWWTDRWTDR